MAESEFWRDIPGYEGRYQASTAGRIRAVWAACGPRLLKPQFRHMKSDSGSSRNEIVLYDANGKRSRKKVAVLVYRTFKGERPDGYIIVHKNGDLMDDSVNNLVLMTNHEAGRCFGGRTDKRKPVAQCNSNGEVLKIFPSLRQCSKATGISWTSLADFCNGLYGPMARDGHVYKWEEDIEY